MSDQDTPVRLVRVWVCCLVTWAASVVGVVVGIVGGDWVVSVWALNSAVVAAGWLQAARRWAAWKVIALGLAYRLGKGDED